MRTINRLGLFLLLPMLVIGYGARSAAQDSKKNLCSITLNSSEEIEVFKKNFSPQLWNFIELKSGSEGDDWFANACMQKINCDVLVVSGHFGGSFFGSNGRLALETLEKKSCDTECDGILKQPKEVFLFGCNTLAGKQRDSRSIDQYIQVLVQDGFSQEQAAQVAAFRYSDYGGTFASRMSQIFSSTPRIYGFNSIAPSGKNVEDYLSKYLNDSKANYSNFSNYIEREQAKTNTLLMSALAETAITQAPGLYFLSQAYRNTEKPYCYFADNQQTVLNKIKYTRAALEQGRALSVISYIKDFFFDLQKRHYSFSQEEQAQLAALQGNQKIIQDFDKALSLKGDVFLKLKTDTLSLMKLLSLIRDQEYQDRLSSLLDLKTPMTLERMDFICSAGLTQQEITVAMLGGQNLNNENLLYVIACLKPKNRELSLKITDVMKGDSDESVRRSAAYALGEIKPQDPVIIRMIADVMKSDTDVDVRFVAAYALGEIKPQDPVIIRMIADVMKNDTEAHVRISAAGQLGKIKAQDPVIIRMIADVMKSDTDVDVRRYAAEALGQIKPQDPVIIRMIADVAENDSNRDVRLYAGWALSEIKPQAP